MKYILALILINSLSFTYAQTISNVIAMQQGNNAIITYDLNGSINNTYYVKLLYSTDGGQNFSRELLHVSGDVKSGIKSGNGKKIIWSADKEINYMSGSVVFKVEAELRKAMPKPYIAEWGSVEITSVKRIDNEIQVGFIYTSGGTNPEKSNISLYGSSAITSSDGIQSEISSGLFGGKPKNTYVECFKGVGVKGMLTFQPNQMDSVIPVIKIVLNGTDIIFKNVAIEQ
jgi:hypothetical protein